MQVWVWIAANLGTFCIIAVTDPAVRSTLAVLATLHTASANPGAVMRALVFMTCAACTIALYGWLYAGDPGFLRTDAQGELAVQQRSYGQEPCAHCGCRPSSRSRHSRALGMCVHRFDHSCWFLSTDVGDRNHGAFGAYLVAQVAWTVWGGCKLARFAVGCAASGWKHECNFSARPLVLALVWLALAWASATLLTVGYLMLLHVYLLATNQTTYEVLRGARVAYLFEHLRGRGAKGYELPQGAGRLLYDELRGRGPSKPFSRGVARNLAALVFESFPRQYELPPLPTELTTLV